MRKLVRIVLIVAVFGFPLGLGLTGCDGDNAGGNEAEALRKAGDVKGTVPANAPKTYEEYADQHQKKK